MENSFEKDSENTGYVTSGNFCQMRTLARIISFLASQIQLEVGASRYFRQTA